MLALAALAPFAEAAFAGAAFVAGRAAGQSGAAGASRLFDEVAAKVLPASGFQTALYFKAVKGTDWENVDPREILGFNYSALGPWTRNVRAEVAKIPNLLPRKRDAACAV